MTDREQEIRRAYEALTGAAAARDDDFEHPGGAMLEALVDGRLDAADREAVETHLLDCQPCAEDVTDLQSMREALTAAPPAAVAGSRRWSNALIYGGVAAAILLVVLLRALPPSSLPAGGPGTATPAASGQSATTTPPPRPAFPGPSALTADEQVIVNTAMTSGRLEVPLETRALAGKVGTLLGAAEPQPAFAPVTPMGSAVLSVSPSFTWRPHPGASAYTVSVFNTDFRPIVRSTRLSGTTWTPGYGPLQRGRTYVWQVRAHLTSGEDETAPAPPHPEARFHIVDERVVQEITELRKRLADRPLQLGILLARAGLLIDAALEFERASERADEAEIARALLADLRARP